MANEITDPKVTGQADMTTTTLEVTPKQALMLTDALDQYLEYLKVNGYDESIRVCQELSAMVAKGWIK